MGLLLVDIPFAKEPEYTMVEMEVGNLIKNSGICKQSFEYLKLDMNFIISLL